MAPKTICVLGGTGFVGHHLVSQLTQKGYNVRVPSRNRERVRSLLVLPQVEVIDCNIFDENALKGLLTGCDAVINLVAILNEHKRGDFKKVHVELPAILSKACYASGVHRVLHMSALNADAKKGSSGYLRSKGEGEDAIHNNDGLNVTSFRPSAIFGPDDHLFTFFANMLSVLPGIAVPCGDALLAPVYVGDVVEAMIKSINNSDTYGQRYDLCGPEVYTMYELVRYTADLVKPKAKIYSLSDGMSAFKGRILGMLPGKLFTYDNYLSLQTPATSDKPFPEIFGITPRTIESAVPYYAGRAGIRGRYDVIRQTAARDPD